MNGIGNFFYSVEWECGMFCYDGIPFMNENADFCKHSGMRMRMRQLIRLLRIICMMCKFFSLALHYKKKIF